MTKAATMTPPMGMPFPGLNADQLMAMQQRSVDAMASAGQIVVDGAKAIALRQSEMMQSAVDEWVASGRVWNAKPSEFKPADQLAKAKGTYEAALTNAKELTEIAVKAQSEAFNVLAKCAMANIHDLKSLAKAA